jgi:hypothetical protein
MTRREVVVSVVLPLGVLLVGGILLLKIEYSFFTKSTTDLQIEARQTVEKLEGHSVEPEYKPSIEPDIEGLNTLLKLVDKVSGPTARNAELLKIVALALEEEKPSFAIEVAGKVSGPSPQNEQFTIILNKCIEWKKFDLAPKAADSLHGPSARNDAFKKIIDAGIKIRGKKELTMRAPLQ